MIKLTFILLICNYLPVVIFSQTPSITNITVSQRTDGSGNVDIYYDLAGPGSSYFITMEVSFNNGNTFTAVSPTFLNGYTGVIPDINRHLIWNGKGSNNNTYSTQTKVKLMASVTGSCGQPITISHMAGTVAPVDKTVTYGTVANIPGEPSKCWITSNLGADHQASAVNDANEASAGWYWQFNRKQGFKHTGTERIPNTVWINYINEYSNWQFANDPCTIEFGSGWRIPSYSEWNNADASGGWTYWNGPWNSGLKLHAAGALSSSSGSLVSRGSGGYYWSRSEGYSADAWLLAFGSGYSAMNNSLKHMGSPFAVSKTDVRHEHEAAKG